MLSRRHQISLRVPDERFCLTMFLVNNSNVWEYFSDLMSNNSSFLSKISYHFAGSNDIIYDWSSLKSFSLSLLPNTTVWFFSSSAATSTHWSPLSLLINLYLSTVLSGASTTSHIRLIYEFLRISGSKPFFSCSCYSIWTISTKSSTLLPTSRFYLNRLSVTLWSRSSLSLSSLVAKA